MIHADQPNEAHTASNWRGGAALADPRVELAAVRTGLAMERSRMSSHRTLMAVMRTALALIGFGFVLFEFLHYARELHGQPELLSVTTVRKAAIALVGVGLGILGLGIVSHGVFQRRLRRQRDLLSNRGLVPPALDLPGSIVTTLAILFFIIGMVAIIRMIYRSGLLGWLGA
jgi:putative membrane protein